MKLYNHQQELYKLPAEMALPALLISTNLDWNGIPKHFTGRRHLNNWLNYVASRYEQDEAWLRQGFKDACDNGYFSLTEVEGGEYYLERELPGV